MLSIPPTDEVEMKSCILPPGGRTVICVGADVVGVPCGAATTISRFAAQIAFGFASAEPQRLNIAAIVCFTEEMGLAQSKRPSAVTRESPCAGCWPCLPDHASGVQLQPRAETKSRVSSSALRQDSA